MERIKKDHQLVANIRTGGFVPFLSNDGEEDGEVLQANDGKSRFGCHVDRMSSGQKTVPHKYIDDEEFLLIKGDLKDHDGYEYKPGDLTKLGEMFR